MKYLFIVAVLSVTFASGFFFNRSMAKPEPEMGNVFRKMVEDSAFWSQVDWAPVSIFKSPRQLRIWSGWGDHAWIDGGPDDRKRVIKINDSDIDETSIVCIVYTKQNQDCFSPYDIVDRP